MKVFISYKTKGTMRVTGLKYSNQRAQGGTPCREPHREKRGVYEVPCKACHLSYIGEMKCTLRVRIGQHKQAVKQGNPNNGIAVHTHQYSNMLSTGMVPK